jgi:hypothetical protein
MEGSTKTTASVPIADCLNRGVHPTRLCQNCVKTPVIGPPGDLFERRSDSPSHCFFEKVIRKRRAFRGGFSAPKAGALGVAPSYETKCPRQTQADSV